MHITKDYKTIPFAELYETYEAAATAAATAATLQAEQRWAEQVQHLEAQQSTGEAPSEVSLADQVAKPSVDITQVRRRYGQRAVAEQWIPRYRLETLLLEAAPQIIAHLGRKPVNWDAATVGGRISGKLALQQLFDFGNRWDRGLYLWTQLDSRSAWIRQQYRGAGSTYCALVPLLLYAAKLYHKIPYSRWSRDDLGSVVNPALAEAMLWTPPQFSREQLLEAREFGLKVQSGAKAGELRNPVSTYKLWSTRGKCLEGAPELAATMLTQIWCAHPQNRHHYMVLDPANWDVMPPPLLQDSIFAETKASSSKPTSSTSDTPW